MIVKFVKNTIVLWSCDLLLRTSIKKGQKNAASSMNGIIMRQLFCPEKCRLGSFLFSFFSQTDEISSNVVKKCIKYTIV